MSERALQPLMTLLEQAERERDEAYTQSQRAAEAQKKAQLQVEQLVNYRGEYDNRFLDQFGQPSSITALQTHQGFTERLGQAIEQQERIATNMQKRAETARAFLMQQEMRVASVRKLIERRLQEMRMAADRRDQKQTDEFAARLAWQRLRQSPSAA